MERLRKETGKAELHFLALDLADLQSVKKAAEHYTLYPFSSRVIHMNPGQQLGDRIARLIQ
jgi:NADP-dependent 3-hydroxy acid dehydrogenase YdfG